MPAQLDPEAPKRIPCEVHAEGLVYRGFAIDLSAKDCFIQLPGSSLPKHGAHVELVLQECREFAGCRMDGHVSFRQIRGHSEQGGRGIGISLEDPGELYVSHFGGDAGAEGGIEVLIEVRVGDPMAPVEPNAQAPCQSNGDRHSTQPGVARDRALRTSHVADEPADDLPVSHPDDDRPVARDSSDSAEGPLANEAALESCATEPVPGTAPGARDEVTRADGRNEQQESGPPAIADAPLTSTSAGRGPRAILIDEGDRLQDLYELLDELGAAPQRARMSGPTRFRGWETAPRLFVVDAQCALTVDLPSTAALEGVACMAVADSHSEVLGTLLRRLGYQYLIRRPVHREALEMLFRHALHRGGEQRGEGRAPLGVSVRLQESTLGWPHPCTLLDLSQTGCRIATRRDVAHLSEVTVRIGRAVLGRLGVALPGRVIRRRRDESTGEWSIAVRFDPIEEEVLERLAELMGRSAIGPTAPLRTAAPERIEAFKRVWRRRLGWLLEAEDDATQRVERRRLARAQLRREIVAFDEEDGRVTAMLHGRDLSVRGMRVEPHPDIEPGQQLTVALFDTTSRETLTFTAEVTRDDGATGLALQFSDMDPDTAARLEQLVASLPSVERLGEGRRRPIVLGRIATARVAARTWNH